MMHPIKLFTNLFFLFPFTSYALTIDSYLEKAHDGAVFGFNDFNTGATENEWSSNWTDDMNFRIDSNNSYSLRMRPKFGDERQAETSIYNANRQKKKIYNQKALNDDLLQRYLNVLDIIDLKLNHIHLKKSKSLLEAKFEAERSLSKSTDFDTERMQTLVYELDRTSSQLTLIDQRIEMLMDSIEVARTENSNALVSRLINPGYIYNTVEYYNEQILNVKSMPAVKLAELDKKISQSRLELLESQESFGLDLVELELAGVDSVGVMFGFRFPDRNTAKRLDRNSDKSKSYIDYMSTHSRMNSSLSRKLSDIKWDYSAWESDHNALQKLEKIISTPRKIQDYGVMINLKNQQLALSKNIDIIHIRMIKNFIELLHMSGLLSQSSFKNWLIDTQ